LFQTIIKKHIVIVILIMKTDEETLRHFTLNQIEKGEIEMGKFL